MTQTPAPGEYRLLFRGDAITFTLQLEQAAAGRAFLRSNLGNAAIQRREIISSIESRIPMRGLDWHDYPMEQIDERSFRVSVALLEPGHFEGKCFFFPDASESPVWPEGQNVNINVEPAEYICANSIYCAFVRQFGINKNAAKSDRSERYLANTERLDNSGWTVIPPSGTFRSLINHLDFIIDELNCRILHLLPVNPTPTVYARMGRYGSPYAALDFTAVDPALAEFDRKATPLDQFCELVDAVHLKTARIFIDLAINHTGWAAKIHETHPEWLVRDEDGSIHSPGAWGVVWGDLTELDHRRLDLWKYLAEVFLTWCERGVDGFRCDAGYMIPAAAWRYIIARVRQSYPDTVFLLEGLGGDPAITEELLNVSNMNWAYSELFQNYTRDEITGYLPYAHRLSRERGIMVHYAETHDNDRLASSSPAYASLRTGICALLSDNGAFGFANGVEWFATEKIDVHEASALNWGAKNNQIAFIARINRLLITHPAFYDGAEIHFLDSHGADPKYDHETLAFIRCARDNKFPLLIIANLNCEEKNLITCPLNPDFDRKELTELLSGNSHSPKPHDQNISLTLEPGEIRCFSPDPEAISRILDSEHRNLVLRPNRIDRQRARGMVLDAITNRQQSPLLPKLNTEDLAEKLLADPLSFCETFRAEPEEPAVVLWNCPRDLHREVMIPPRHLLLLQAASRFRARLEDHQEHEVLIQRDSLPAYDGSHFVLLPPQAIPTAMRKIHLHISLLGEAGLSRERATVCYLPQQAPLPTFQLKNNDIRMPQSVFIAGNGRGAMCHLPLCWGEISSKYDALLAANIHSEFPVDRQIMWTRCRIWIRNQAHSQMLSVDSCTAFTQHPDGSGSWDFHLPAGNGRYVDLSCRIAMLPGKNATLIEVRRHPEGPDELFLADDIPIRLIFRPDLENRNFHHETKISSEMEESWLRAVAPEDDRFSFAPVSEHRLQLRISQGKFKSEPEWQRHIHHEIEACRGLDPEGDLFSPGLFESSLCGGEKLSLLGEVLRKGESPGATDIPEFRQTDQILSEPGKALAKAMELFIVRRNELKTVIAGYPWFLDWGRDTLVCCRGLISAGYTDDVAEILLAFANFAEDGTLPNIIHGEEAGNRDTSDAPLWLFVAVEEFVREFPLMNLLSHRLERNQQTLLEVLIGIAEAYLAGTPNGIRTDPDSGLVFSPAHFTWMDTNYPAGTPRQGYPIEIQALWFAALNFLFKSTGQERWRDTAEQVRQSVLRYFPRPEGWLSDCLHANPETPAAAANADDHLRPNQLFAITLDTIPESEQKMRHDILDACAELLVPGAIRSLADRPVKFHLPISDRNGRKLNNPSNPYWGHYEGDEDARRKPAYHNGTAWTWPFPSYAEAYLKSYGENGKASAIALLDSMWPLFQSGCLGQIPEIVDGNAPHHPRGCDAQAWGITEFYRVWKKLRN